jgi:hypothetical protein
VNGTDDATTQDPTHTHSAVGSPGSYNSVAQSLRSSAGQLCPGSARSPRNHTRARPSGRNRRPACAHGRERKEAPKIETKPYVLLQLFFYQYHTYTYTYGAVYARSDGLFFYNGSCAAWQKKYKNTKINTHKYKKIRDRYSFSFGVRIEDESNNNAAHLTNRARAKNSFGARYLNRRRFELPNLSTMHFFCQAA